MPQVIKLTSELIEICSVTPEDGGCQKLIAQRLEKLGFIIQHCPFGDVSNLWAITPGEGEIVCFLGHTDVVPAGDESLWNTSPFEAKTMNGAIYGRGSADMKSAIAAMICALEQELQRLPSKRRMAVLLTSDEEGIAENGVRRVMPWLQQRGELMRYCLIGEPTSNTVLGDTIKVGRRGSLSCFLEIRGEQGHVAYPQLCDNPIHKSLPFLTELSQLQWDKANKYFSATSLQIVGVEVDNKVLNIVPASIKVRFNMRYSTEQTLDRVQRKVAHLLQKHNLSSCTEVDWLHSGLPFLTEGGLLVDTVSASIREQRHIETERSTTGGTSDGRFVAPYNIEVVECGVCNATIHQVNEHCAVEDIVQLQLIYQSILRKLLF